MNVLFIVADDLRDAGGAFTRESVKTPNLDRLAARGTRFERAYVQYPVCNPSRCSFLTGLRAEQTGIVGNDQPLRSAQPDAVTLPQLFKENGYYSAAFGKIYHLGGGRDEEKRREWMDIPKSWHEAKAFEATKAGKVMIEGRNVTGGKLDWCRWGMAAGKDEDQPDGQIASATIAMIEKLGSKPWFIGCGFMKPHDPFIAPKQYFDLYPAASLKSWHDPKDKTDAPPQAIGFGAYGEAFAKLTAEDWAELHRAYCAGTSFMDAQLGRVMDALDKHQLWDKTVVVFVGDHGYHTGERLWWNKNTLYERSCRAPLIIAAPGMMAGQVSNSLVEFVDLYPTLAEFAGLKTPERLAGRSLQPVLKDASKVVKDAAFTLVTRGPKLYGQSVRTSRWRFIQWSDGAHELYDHETDPEEMHNVAKDHPEQLSSLMQRLKILPELKVNP